MIATPLSGSRRTTLYAGAGFAAVAAWELVKAFQLQIPAPNLFTTPFVASGIGYLSAVVLVAVCVLLATGARGEAGLLASSPVAGVALIMFGAGQIVTLLAQQLTPAGALDGSLQVIIVFSMLTIVPALALFVTAVTVTRRRLLEPIARLALLVMASCTLVMTAISFIPTEALIWVAIHGYTAIVLAMLALSVGLVVHGRSSQIRHRLHVINEGW
ncbi:hypothetical protein DZF95_00920 [Clavibacter michiganensis]|nr:hypothetical protein DZF95_00920 [Clavibacter michiganensis]